MTKVTANRIRLMIEKEICRDSLAELCEMWGVTTDDVKAFLDAGMEAAE